MHVVTERADQICSQYWSDGNAVAIYLYITSLNVFSSAELSFADDQISPCKLNMLALANTFYYPSVSTPAVTPIMTTAGSSSYGERVSL